MHISGPLNALWTAVERARERSRVADMDVRDSVRELGAYMDVSLDKSALEGYVGSPLQKRIEGEISRVRAELAFAREISGDASAALLRAEAALKAALR